MRTHWLTAACLWLAAAGLARGDVTLPAVLSDHMVLQRDTAVPIWGRAAPGEKVTVAIAGQTKAATADAKGAWMVTLDALKAGGPHTMTVSGKNTLTVSDILVGEVWLCSGQSNMAMAVGGARDAAQEAAAANYPQIRHFRVARTSARTPQGKGKGAWVVCSPRTVKGFTATGYFFGRDLHKHLKVPVGLINSSVGGTPVEAWTPASALADDPALKTLLDQRAESRKPANAQAQKAFEAQLARWKLAAAKAKAAGKKPPRKPRDRGRAMGAQPFGGLYNGMIAPLVPFAIRGATWYQGERNCNNGTQWLYRKLLPALITSWRKAWARDDLPFLYVQLPNFRGHHAHIPDDWAVMRESMAETLKLPATGMAVTIDIGEERDIHPRNKQDVGARLALAARAVAYGEKLCHSGPLYESAKFEGARARLSFRHVGDGLVAKGGRLTGFMIAGKDRKFVAAEATIEGAEVVVSAAGVAEPLAVRYAWANNPTCTLANKAGLPASPFRTDTWPVPGQPGHQVTKLK
jgi:sialate O-acetylesterase